MEKKDKKESEFLTKEELIEFGKFLMIFDPELKRLNGAFESVARSYRDREMEEECERKEHEDD